jgi:hypothetical protein
MHHQILITIVFFQQNNAKLEVYDEKGLTPLYYARLNGYKEVEELLKQHGCSETHNYSNGSAYRHRDNLSTLTETGDILDKLPASNI